MICWQALIISLFSFSCEVYVTVDPTADVKKVQTDISDLLSSIFSFNFLTIEVVYDSIMVLPAGESCMLQFTHQTELTKNSSKGAVLI